MTPGPAVARITTIAGAAAVALALLSGCAPRPPALPNGAPELSVGTSMVEPAQVTVVPNGGKPTVDAPRTPRSAVSIADGRIRLHLAGPARPSTLAVGQYSRLSPGGTPVDGGEMVDCATSSRYPLERDRNGTGFTATVPLDSTAKTIIVRAVYRVDRGAVDRLAPGSTEKVSAVWAVDVRQGAG